jgi:hypothetical protein
MSNLKIENNENVGHHAALKIEKRLYILYFYYIIRFEFPALFVLTSSIRQLKEKNLRRLILDLEVL